MDNYNLDIKRTFLSFAQALFARHSKYTWNVEPKLTKVLILDKHVINLEVLEAKRSIVLSRGTYGWRHTSLGQLGDNSKRTIGDMEVHGSNYMDLLRGSITFNCIAQNGLIAEDMAHILFSNLTGQKAQFKANGIHQITSMTIGEETLLKTDSSIELTAIPVYVQFETSKSLGFGYSDHSTFYLRDANGQLYHEGIEYYVANRDIFFYEPPAVGTVFTAVYTHGVTLQTITEQIIGSVDGANTQFTVSYPPYTTYTVFSGIETTVSGLSWNQ